MIASDRRIADSTPLESRASKGRRRLLAILSSLSLLPSLAVAQTRLRIGLLSVGTDPAVPNPVWTAFIDELNRSGFVEGKSVEIERRFAAGREDRLPDFAAELAAMRLDMVVVTGDVEAAAARRSMPAKPIVMVLVQDPVGAGLAQSLAKPGGNVTGLTTQAPELYRKRLELLKELIPSLGSVALLMNPDSPGASSAARDIANAAVSLGIVLRNVVIRNPGELDNAFTALESPRTQALIVVTDGVTYSQRARISALASRSRIPAIYEVRAFVDAGGLISFGPSYTDLARRAAGYVDRIVKGAKPADLPIEQPSRFEIVVNIKAAKSLGIVVPQAILLRADDVIQ